MRVGSLNISYYLYTNAIARFSQAEEILIATTLTMHKYEDSTAQTSTSFELLNMHTSHPVFIAGALHLVTNITYNS